MMVLFIYVCRCHWCLCLLSYSEQNIDIIATYSNNLGAVQSSRVKMGDLSASWVLENPVDGRQEYPKRFEVLDIQFLIIAEGNEGHID